MKRLGLLLTFALLTNLARPQDTTSLKTVPFQMYSLKISYLLFLGEIPLVFEYRPTKKIGHEFLVGYTYFNIEPGSKQNIGNGYKLKYGLRIYYQSKKKENQLWFINPQIFYKQMWINDRFYNSDYSPLDSGGHERNDTYSYNENRKVYAFELLFGITKKKAKSTFEFCFGFGVRLIDSFNSITKWHSLSSSPSYFPLPDNLPTHVYRMKVYPSFQIGCNISIPVKKSKTQ
jgi:hypothetical protein